MLQRASVLGILMATAAVSGCVREAAPQPAPAASTIAPRKYPLKGIVKRVDVPSGEVTIAHDEVPGFMPKMTMPFTLKDKATLEDLQAGDEVEGTLLVTYAGDQVKDVDLTGLEVTRPATRSETIAIDELAHGQPPEPLKPGDLVPDFAVTTQEGRTLRLSELKGKVVILTFIYTRCPFPEFCPAIDAKFADLARRIATVPARADRLRLLSVSFDPEHDTTETLTAHAARRGAKPPLWTFAVAGHDELARVVGPLGFSYAPGTREIEHNLRTAVIGPDGRLVRLETGSNWTTTDLLKSAYAEIGPNQ